MATNLDRDPDLAERALTLSGAPTKKAAVTAALQEQHGSVRKALVGRAQATHQPNRTRSAQAWMGSLIPVALVLLATTVSLASVCVGADGHVNLELRLSAGCGDAGPAPSAARESALPEASPCCGPCLHVGADDEQWLAAHVPTAKRSPVSFVLEAHRPSTAQSFASHFLPGLARGPDAAQRLASVIIRC